ncbi:hypothetical protein AURDEDRAFT_116689 [Auricularia subglabra TFB-10046 SS5]|uniref:Secreted protein n=1 Tax=Auricularia subglabra (strain TFB-10046 / SS5) TaxID=717982 RepID=J0DB13_AURST|nr:hypothetical protein AURDEDRAFT_116689 [Auricularia subglabra TFB-10046 SS5]
MSARLFRAWLRFIGLGKCVPFLDALCRSGARFTSVARANRPPRRILLPHPQPPAAVPSRGYSVDKRFPNASLWF